MNITIIHKNIFLLIGKNKILAVLFVIIFNTSYCKAQLYKEELYEIIQKRYYNEYVKDYYLINFGKDSIKIKLSYVFKEFFIGYFNNYRIFQISLSGYGNISMIYFVNINGNIIGNYFIAFNSFLNDSKIKLSNFEKSLFLFLVTSDRPLNCVITNEKLLKKLSVQLSKDFTRNIATEDDDGAFNFNEYPFRITKNKVSFYVYSTNIDTDKKEITKNTYFFKKGLLVKKGEEFIKEVN